MPGFVWDLLKKYTRLTVSSREDCEDLLRQTVPLELKDSEVAETLSCHEDTAQGTQSRLLGAFLAFCCVFMA